MRLVWMGMMAVVLAWNGGALAAGDVAAKGCAVLAGRVDAIAGTGPVFLRSFDQAGDEPALAGAAFTYDNALAVHALLACGKVSQARRIGEALLAAATGDRAGPVDGRLRNAYRAGPQDGPPQPNGWWDAKANLWAEDPAQVGTATGNAAWAGLALLAMAEATGESRYRDGAGRLARWVVAHTADERGGFSGGIHGDGAGARVLGWKSTEHNVDLAAFLAWAGYPRQAAAARAFVASQWQGASGHFLTGTLPDGVTPNRATSGLDAQLWPLLLEKPQAEWRQVLDYAERAHGVDGGFDFNDDRDGIWWEGTAQAALAYRAAGQGAKADAILAVLAGQFSPGGLIWAASVPRLTTGLALGPDSTEADFVYWRRPHLGATAWAVLAATGWNPFTGNRIIP